MPHEHALHARPRLLLLLGCARAARVAARGRAASAAHGRVREAGLRLLVHVAGGQLALGCQLEVHDQTAQATVEGQQVP
jgi:hypothetical protein